MRNRVYLISSRMRVCNQRQSKPHSKQIRGRPLLMYVLDILGRSMLADSRYRRETGVQIDARRKKTKRERKKSKTINK